MEKYKFLFHTADAKFQAFGQTLEEAFCHAALAVASLMWDWRKVQKGKQVRVKVQGIDQEQLLVSFLEEVLYLRDTRKFLLGEVNNITIEQKGRQHELRAVFKGDDDASRYKIFGEVKAITYNEMKIEKKTRFMVQVVVDI